MELSRILTGTVQYSCCKLPPVSRILLHILPEGHLIISLSSCVQLKVEAKLFNNSFLSTLPVMSVWLQNPLPELGKTSY